MDEQHQHNTAWIFLKDKQKVKASLYLLIFKISKEHKLNT